MADKVEIQGPLSTTLRTQRNTLDVATELTQLHIDKYGMADEDYIKKVFAEYYSLVFHLERTAFSDSSKLLLEFLPEDIKKNLHQYRAL